ncbi:hypothetical protein V6N11_001369 [Hibiscus sabdariffa]|uniref:Uncharacterized protein n=1 Tax=Hibiscus sabdariffa TaxID=183260 RepID=A0ABR2RZJ3_9ROSI
MMTPSTSASGLPSRLMSSPTTPHSLSPSVASSSVAYGPGTFLARPGSQLNIVAKVNVTPNHVSGEQLTSSSSSNVAQGSALVDTLVTPGPHVVATRGEACPEVLGESGTEAHVAGQDEVGESCVGTYATGQNEVNPQLCDGGLCSV